MRLSGLVYICAALLLPPFCTTSHAQQQMASLRPGGGLVWQRTSPSVQKPDGPVLYQLIFNASGVPGTVPVFDTNPRHLTNSPITISSGNVVIGGGSALNINGSSGIISFAPGQTFPPSGLPNLAGEVTGAPSATVVSNAVATDTANAIVRRDSSGNFSAAKVSLDASLDVPYTTSSSVGVITMGGFPVLHVFGSANTFLGLAAGNFTTNGIENTGIGQASLVGLGNGRENTAVGYAALENNSTGNSNSALGSHALVSNTNGTRNSAFGANALFSNTSGVDNAAFGVSALSANSGAARNSAFGSSALQNNGTGSDNTAFGYQALQLGTSNYNSAFGSYALAILSAGFENTAIGTLALDNLGLGGGSGSLNVAVGFEAGSILENGFNNIYIGSQGGSANESNTIRIGSAQSATFIDGIYGATSASGTNVLINLNGQLGTTTSSRRYKQDIADLGAESDVLMKLRPVAFYYKPELDSTHTRQYGLVAEEVAQIAPNLVLFDKDGKPQTVRYHFVNAMLLNEVQKQRQLIETQKSTNEALQKQLVAQEQQIDHLTAMLQNQQTSQQAEMVSLREEIRALSALLEKSNASSLARLAGQR